MGWPEKKEGGHSKKARLLQGFITAESIRATDGIP
jgi:hypothetical protein